MTLFSHQAAEPGKPYWWEDAAPLKALPSNAPETAELLVIGAGYTGLSAALTAADQGANVVVVDAGVPGIGASTRNGGMFGAHPRMPYEALTSMFGEDTASGIFSEAQDAFEHTSSLIKNENIDCSFEQTGRIQLAWTKQHFEAQKKLVTAIRNVADMPLEIIERDAVKEHIGSDHFFGAIYFPNHAALQPKHFHDGLLAAVLKRNVQVIQSWPVYDISQTSDGFTITSEAGHTIRASRVLVATNGYTSGKLDWFKRRVYPFPSFLVATEPLSKAQLKKLAPGRRMMVETRAQHSYFRLSPDGTRIVFGGRASMRPIPLKTAARRLHRNMCSVWPEMQDIKLTHVWSGNTGFSFAQMPHVGVQQGIHYAMGYSGSGVALAAYLGSKAALRCLGDPEGKTAYANTTLSSRWYYRGGKPWFLSPADLWFRHYTDRKENRQAFADRSDTR